MHIHGFNKTTLLDYPGRVAATIFTGSCNFRCPFCQNADLVLFPDTQPLVDEEKVLHLLMKRKGILTGLCITGGEPTLQPDLADFIRKVKKLGYQVKLDTNGYRPDVLRALHEEQLLDYVAMDIKSSPEHYTKAAGISLLDLKRIQDSVSFIQSCGLPYEFRTTVVRELHTAADFISIAKWLNGSSAYFLQSYTDSGRILKPGLSACTREELEYFSQLVRPYIPNTQLRGID